MNKVLAAKKRHCEFELERFIDGLGLSVDDARNALFNIQMRKLTERNNLFSHQESTLISLREMTGDFQ